ncbi:hypothetical protein FIV06_31470 (plasmid) [Labrenzia sp. THAF191b]|uniref:DUF1419 domain-containing protein n=1 Tax=Roseibium alexandrii (strain DSM 17067 / NCIMB 14079 / DFL-11) TaxID=244592 RepID=A0A5E8H5X6_ROSAD|nr:MULTISPECIES: DUF1419 domain-containing protein [Stappiaceae]EEE48188.2 hypothetical protein SADFL11_82 [Roseibium alexandrii DFL-11]QFT01997.1 hypothetical protein FIV06_31470 [Labrenzia sp. THAF191b]QFT08284.1 hypothetical protein FIV05_31335 [Labrenzia sp. THAF191a]QFT19846.1 hypothetical protein FIV03_31440 [Labrenzia sp. THAF187b]QFT71186.1 hypothetical protein FIU93_30635 [Labrenzia sp. THAF35]
MTSPIRKIYFGVTDRRQMFRLFDRHARRPDRWQKDDSALYAGEWFEIAQDQHDYMLDILPPLWMRGDMFAMREFLTGSVTSVFYNLHINGAMRFFHAYCDLSDPRSPYAMREAIALRERWPVKAMTREERLEHIWSATHDDYRGYAGEGFSPKHRGKRTVFVHSQPGTRFQLLESLSDAQISEKLPVQLRHLPALAAA